MGIEAERLPQTPTELTLEQLYKERLPAALIQQQGLFKYLETIGVIKMINSVITPDVITPNKTDQQKYKIQERAKAKKPKEPGVTTYMDPKLVSKWWFGMWDQKWQAGVSSPSQREDGTLDPTLEIWIDNDTTSFRIHREEYQIPLRTITLSYSPKGLLTIKGRKTEFEALVAGKDVNMSAISAAFQKTLKHPMTQFLPSSRPSDAEMSATCNW